MLGNEAFLHLLADGKPFLARVDPRTKAHSGSETDVVFDASKMHVFDIKTGAAQ